MEHIDLPTADGPCRTLVFTPTGGAGPWPAVLFCFDAPGQRPATEQMAQELADAGFVVAMPDLFHRAGNVLDILPPEAPRSPASLFANLREPAVRAAFAQRFFISASNPAHLRIDIGATIALLDGRADVSQRALGITGYCMGGLCALRAAALFPERIAAAASFHGGGLVTDAPESPHRNAAQMKAAVLVAGAIEDSGFTDAMKTALSEAFAAAGVRATVETYPARHGFAVPDSPAYDSAAAARHHLALVAHLREGLAARASTEVR